MNRKFYLVLDTETATLPFANDVCKDATQKQKIAIAKPLVYDIGWLIIDRQGNIYKKVNYLVQETFFVPNVFNTAYYCNKRPIYMEMLANNEISAKNWKDIAKELQEDLENINIATAYNATFDYKKAIPFTEKYIYHLYRSDFNDWEKKQNKSCKTLLYGKNTDNKNSDFLKPVFNFKNKEYPMCDLWGLACEKLINIDKYRNFCLENNLLTTSKTFFKTSAETSFQYLMKDFDFIESHTALSDAEIESQILLKALKKGAVNPLLIPFPFKELGTTYDYVKEKKPKYKEILAESIAEYLETLKPNTSYYTKMQNILATL